MGKGQKKTCKQIQKAKKHGKYSISAAMREMIKQRTAIIFLSDQQVNKVYKIG